MKTVRMRTFIAVSLGFCWAFMSVGCQWISGLDELRVSSKEEGESVTSSSGGAGGFGGGTAASGAGGILAGGGGDITVGNCTLLDLPGQAPVYCSIDQGQSATVTFHNQCDMKEALDLYWIPPDTGNGICGIEQYHTQFPAGTSTNYNTTLGYRFRIRENTTQRVVKDDIVIEQDGQIITVP